MGYFGIFTHCFEGTVQMSWNQQLRFQSETTFAHLRTAADIHVAGARDARRRPRPEAVLRVCLVCQRPLLGACQVRPAPMHEHLI